MKKNILMILLLAVLKVEAQTSTFAVSDSLFAKGRYKLALKELDKKTPSFLSNYKKAIIYESIDDYKSSANFYEKALTFKDDYKTKLKLAKNYRSLKQSKKAIKIYEAILEKDSLNLVLKYQLGKLYIINRKPDKAISTFKYLIKQDQLNANYSYHLGLSYTLKGKRDPMINSFIDTYKKDSLHIKSISRLASSFNKLKEYDSTMIFVDKGLAINKNHINLNKIKINLLYRKKKYVEVLPFLLNLDTIDKKETFSKTLLGRIYYNLDSLELAKKYFTKITYLDGEDYKAHTYLGHIAYKQKDYKTAWMNYLMATIKGKKARDEEYYGIASVYYAQKKPKQALKFFEKAFEENSRNYKALYQFAKLSDDYYKDKKIAYKLYNKYTENFYEKDKDMYNFAKRRIKEIKKAYFMKGESLK